MKNIGFLLVFLLLTACGTTQMVQSPETPPAGPDGLKANTNGIVEVSKEVNFTDANLVGGHMNYLASDKLKGRDTGSEGIEMAARYIENRFKDYGVKPYFKTYRDTLSNYKKPAYNIVGMVLGSDSSLKDEFILIGAHYDHIGVTRPQNGDYIANGANDNASGTSTVLELARYFGTKKVNKRSLIFALFSAEEKGLLGSEHLAKKLKKMDLNLYTMLNFEMTGVPLRGKDYELFITGYDISNLAKVSNKYAGEKLIGYSSIAEENDLFKRSDNYPFHKVFGVPSHTFCGFDFTNFPHYHRPSDENSEMDFDHMARVVNKMIPVVEGIANAPNQEIKKK
ncbi:M28 family metallopeptidase [Allomuricauda sp. SCSIO 65647]|uniref:M28 family metallopeptidase n=1 Tax=Allomuricauda sp. SCSIO 65647 TaxID=2908843 RepID=UPI001F437ACB|nr:M28 family peptidase [Muricauda sp. SCSIO 65647]UJH66508.1 M28 family peptidase [Muricauda sp. SCSIO 65647]